MSDTKKHPTTISNTRMAYVGATSSNVKFLLAENEKLEKKLLLSRHNIYDGFVAMNKEFVCVHDLQEWSKEFVQTLKNIHDSITHVQEWIMQHKGPHFT